MLSTLPFLMAYCTLTFLLVRKDLEEGLLPDKYLCPLLWSGLLYQLICQPAFLPSAVTGAMAGYVGFACLYWSYWLIYKTEGLGYGDVKYFAALGAWHGWKALPAIALSAALLATVYIVIQMLRFPDLEVQKNPLPFGPFLAVAGLLNGGLSLFSFPL